MSVLRRAFVVAVGIVAVGVTGGAVLAFLTFGTGAPTSASSASPTSGTVARAAASADAPAAFRDRPTFRSCGEVVLGPGGTIPAQRIACLAATAGEGRELVVVSQAPEGDPVVRWYRTGPDLEGVEIFEDATADRSGGRWRRSDCTSGQIDQTGACA